jgi:hypothetical protein
MGIEAEMTPGGTSDEKLMVEQVERLGARRLAGVVVNPIATGTRGCTRRCGSRWRLRH